MIKILLVMIFLALGWVSGGLKRIVSTYVFLCLLMGLTIGYLGFSVFLFLTHQPLLMPGKVHGYLNALSTYPSLHADFVRAELITYGLFLVGILVHTFEYFSPQKKALGDARFATGLGLARAGFLKKKPESIIIGKKYGVPLYANGFEHVLVFAPTGSGKTRSISVPNLMHYPYSVVCNDIKLTLFKLTSGFREKVLGHRCYCWAPTNSDRQTHRYNPLSLISNDPLQRMTDIQRIAHSLIPDSKKSDPIWQQASRKLFKTVVLYLLDTPDRPTTLGEINRIIKQASFDDWLASILQNTDHLDPEFYRNGYSYLNNHEKTRSSILETFSGYFELFDDPMIDAATAHSDFDLNQLRTKKMTIYVGFTDDDMERLSPLLTLFWQQVMGCMIKKVPYLKEEPYPLLCLIDEFSSLGRIEHLRRSLKLLREYRVRCVLMLQYIAQTYEQYSHDEAKAFTNIKTKIAFAAEDLNDAEYISKLLGSRTIRTRSGSFSRQVNGYSESQNYTYQTVPLMRPEKIMRLPLKQTLIMRTGDSPIKAGQLIWYKDRNMKGLVRLPAQVPEQVVNRVPFIKPFTEV